MSRVRLLLECRTGERYRRAKCHQRGVARKCSDLGKEVGDLRGDRASLDRELGKGLQLRFVRELTLRKKVPDLLEGAPARQFNGVVAPVVEETLLATHIAHRRLGDCDAFEPARREPGQRGSSRLDLLYMRNTNNVADRKDAGNLVPVHHGQVPEAPLAEDLEPLLDRVGDRDRHGVLGHDLVDLRDRGIHAVTD